MSSAGAAIGLGQLADITDRLPSGTMHELDLRDARREAQSFAEEDQAKEFVEEDSELAHMKGEFDANLALSLSEDQLSLISMELLRGIDSDILSRKDWEGIAEKAIDYLGVKLEAATTQVGVEGNVSKVFHTLLLESAVYFWANSHAELLPASGPCKVRDDHPPTSTDQPAPPGTPNPQALPADGTPPAGNNAPPQLDRAAMATAFELDMNHYLTAVDRQYYRDFSRMLFSLGPMGTEFRKVYWCPQRRRPVSEWVKGRNLIVSNEAADLSTAARVTEQILMRQSAVRRLQLSGWWRDVSLSTMPAQNVSRVKRAEDATVGINPNITLPADYQHTIYECYCELDIPGFGHQEEIGSDTGLPLPYRVTIERDSKRILEIRRNWKEDDPNFTARKRYVMYGMVPGLGFYYFGYIHILGNTQRALTAIERQLLDAGQYANFPGFLYAKGGYKGETNEIRVPPGGGQMVNTNGAPIQQVVMPLPYKDVSPGLLKMWETLASDGRKLSSMTEMPVGEGRADVPVGTVIAMIEQTTKVMNAVHKGLHASMQEELLLLKEQFAEDPGALWQFAKTPARKWEQAEEFNDVDLVPASDPNVPSQLHRTMQSMGLFMIGQQAASLGVLNLQEVLKRVFQTMNVQDIQALFTNPTQPPQPPQQSQQSDPAKMAEVHLKGIEQQRKAANEQQTLAQEQQTLSANMANDQQERQVKLEIARLNHEEARMRLLQQLHQSNKEDYHKHADRYFEAQDAAAERRHEERLANTAHRVDLHNAHQDRIAAAKKEAAKPKGGKEK